jgi:hypothetical protein
VFRLLALLRPVCRKAVNRRCSARMPALGKHQPFVAPHDLVRVGDVISVAWLRVRPLFVSKTRLGLRLGLRWDGRNGSRRCRFGVLYRRARRLTRFGFKRAVWSFAILLGRVGQVTQHPFPQLTLHCRMRRVLVIVRFCLSSPNLLRVSRVRSATRFSCRYKTKCLALKFRARHARLLPLRRVHRKRRR